MVELIKEYEAADIDVGLTPEGNAVLTLITDQGHVVVHLRRRPLEMLGARIARELERVPKPSRPH